MGLWRLGANYCAHNNTNKIIKKMVQVLGELRKVGCLSNTSKTKNNGSLHTLWANTVASIHCNNSLPKKKKRQMTKETERKAFS
jgi:hypothetical protein